MSIHRALGHHGTGDMMMGNGTHHTVEDVFTESDETISAWILIVVSGVLMCIAVPCNLLVLIAFRTEKKLRTYGNIFIINLCVSDLCVGAINMPLTVLEEYMKLKGRGWPFDHIPCHLVKTLQHIFFSASIMTVLIICNDRYQAIRHPLSHIQSRTTKKAVLKVAFAWGLASFVWLSFILIWGLVEGDDSLPDNFCTAMYNTNHYSTGVAIALDMWIPYPAILVMYFRVYRKIHAVRREEKSGRVKGENRKKTAVHEGSSWSGQEGRKTELTKLCGSGSPREEILTVSSIQLKFCKHHHITLGDGTAEDASPHGANGYDPRSVSPLEFEIPGEMKEQCGKAKPNMYGGIDETPIISPPAVIPSSLPLTSNHAASSPVPHPKVALRRSGKIHIDNKKAMLTLALVVASYAICWLPYSIIVPITSICDMHPGAFPPLPAYFNAAVVAFSMCQSAVNPFCYAAAQPAIRHTVYKILACYRCHSKTTP